MARQTLDDFLSEFGNPGKCQILYGIIIISIALQWTILQQFSVVLSYVPEHFCKPPTNMSEQYFNNDECSISVRGINQTEEKISCPNGWEYKTLRREIYPSNEFDLVCDREFLFRLALTMPYVGIMFGSLVFGFLADKYGRKKTMVCLLPIVCALTIGCAFSSNLTIFITLRFFIGFFTQGVQTSVTTYSSELFRRKSRAIVSNIIAILCAISQPIQIYLMYLLLNWRTLIFLQGLILTIAIVTSCCLPESVTWLISKNKLENSKLILKKFAKINKLPISETFDADLEVQAEQFIERKSESKSELQNYGILFCHPSVMRITLSIMYMTFVINLVSNGLTFSISALGGNVYTNYAINAVLEVFVLVISLFLFNWFGRIRIFMILFSACGILCIAGYILIFYSKNWNGVIQTAALLMALVSNTFTSASIAMLPTFTSELLPTFLRSTGIGLGFLAGRFGSVINPQILYTLDDIWEPLPQTLYGILMLIAVIVIWFLPETFNILLPHTLDDVDAMMRNSPNEEKRPLLGDKHISKCDYKT